MSDDCNARIQLPSAVRGSSYSWRATFPDASFLTGSPDDVVCHVRRRPGSDTLDGEFSVTVDGASLVLSMTAVDLPVGLVYTDLDVGATTYVRAQFVVLQEVSISNG